MLLIRPTKSLAQKLKVELGTSVEGKDALWGEWYANNFRFGRNDLVLFVNAKTFLPLVVKATPYRDLMPRFLEELGKFLVKVGHAELIKNIGPGVIFAKTQDRSIVGVMNQFIKDLSVEDYLGRLGSEETEAMTLRLAKTLVGPRNYKSPLEMFTEEMGVQPIKLVTKNVDPSRFRVGTNPIGTSIFKILQGIQGEWGLIDSEMADVLQRTPSTYGTWVSAQSVSVSVDRPSANDQIIFAFIDIFDLASSLIYREEQRKEWIRIPNPALGGRSPLDIMRTSAEDLFEFRHYLQRLINP